MGQIYELKIIENVKTSHQINKNQDSLSRSQSPSPGQVCQWLHTPLVPIAQFSCLLHETVVLYIQEIENHTSLDITVMVFQL